MYVTFPSDDLPRMTCDGRRLPGSIVWPVDPEMVAVDPAVSLPSRRISPADPAVARMGRDKDDQPTTHPCRVPQPRVLYQQEAILRVSDGIIFHPSPIYYFEDLEFGHMNNLRRWCSQLFPGERHGSEQVDDGGLSSSAAYSTRIGMARITHQPPTPPAPSSPDIGHFSTLHFDDETPDTQYSNCILSSNTRLKAGTPNVPGEDQSFANENQQECHAAQGYNQLNIDGIGDEDVMSYTSYTRLQLGLTPNLLNTPSLLDQANTAVRPQSSAGSKLPLLYIADHDSRQSKHKQYNTDGEDNDVVEGLKGGQRDAAPSRTMATDAKKIRNKSPTFLPFWPPTCKIFSATGMESRASHFHWVLQHCRRSKHRPTSEALLSANCLLFVVVMVCTARPSMGRHDG
ncbi:hypothetical protein ACRALDRAFT_1094887 [Sodiomyces alcalophilus JCM 7366]|uniref:uncharacterized protein n=1 Tax=Sodiomyces alcalophilus JCM 7366 TaxID=591952 RepID=UPI0039B43401